MGLFDAILKRGKDHASANRVSADRVGAEYERIVRAGATPSGMLTFRYGDQFRDLGDRSKAVEYYELAAKRLIAEEQWNSAESICKRVIQMLGKPTVNILLAQMELGLGRKLYPAARGAIEALTTRIKPSEGAVIEQMVETVDSYAVNDLTVEVSLAEFLCTVGRPEIAVSRLRLALRMAENAGDAGMTASIRERLGELDPMGIAFTLPAPRPVTQAETVVKTNAPAGTSVRLEAEEVGPDTSVNDLVRQLRSGLDDSIPDGDLDLALAFIQMGLMDEALREFTAHARALVEAGEGARALEVLESAGELVVAASDMRPLSYWRARSHEVLGDRVSARALYQGLADYMDSRARLEAA